MFTNIKDPKPVKEGLDALIVGAGFSGVYHLYRLRKLGMSVKVFEAGSSLGGTWYWNCYPGARVDSDFCVYQFSMEELWKDWNYTERFPGWKEIRGYFNYMDKKLDLSRDISFDTRVVSAKFNGSTDRWSVTAHDGTTVHPRYLILCTGFSAKPHMPVYKGLYTFEGIWTHTARWPQGGIDLKNKRIAVVGTGASGVQVIQEAAREASQITVFQRTPCLALPLKQHKVDEKMQTKMKEELYPYILRRRPQTFAGFHFDLIYKKVADLSPEEIMISFEELWEKGGFHFWLAGYADMLRNEHFNEQAYAFWRKKVLEKVHDPEMQRKLAPAVPPYPIGAKRPCLEDDYYEIYNQSNVALIDVHENPISEVTPKGLKTKDGVEHEFDIIVFATGFDAVTGGITEMDIRGIDGVSIGEKWRKDGLSTYLGLMTTGFPNMFFPFGPHGPTAFCNGPTCAEVQGGWVADCLEHLQKNQLTRIVPVKEAEDEWVKFVNGIHNGGLWNRAKTWYTGANIPGKRIEPLNFVGGVPLYNSKCKESAENGFEGFVLTGPGAGVERKSAISKHLYYRFSYAIIKNGSGRSYSEHTRKAKEASALQKLTLIVTSNLPPIGERRLPASFPILSSLNFLKLTSPVIPNLTAANFANLQTLIIIRPIRSHPLKLERIVHVLQASSVLVRFELETRLDLPIRPLLNLIKGDHTGLITMLTLTYLSLRTNNNPVLLNYLITPELHSLHLDALDGKRLGGAEATVAALSTMLSRMDSTSSGAFTQECGIEVLELAGVSIYRSLHGQNGLWERCFRHMKALRCIIARNVDAEHLVELLSQGIDTFSTSSYGTNDGQSFPDNIICPRLEYFVVSVPEISDAMMAFKTARPYVSIVALGYTGSPMDAWNIKNNASVTASSPAINDLGFEFHFDHILPIRRITVPEGGSSTLEWPTAIPGGFGFGSNFSKTRRSTPISGTA